MKFAIIHVILFSILLYDVVRATIFLSNCTIHTMRNRAVWVHLKRNQTYMPTVNYNAISMR